jgi:hypothetical protein
VNAMPHLFMLVVFSLLLSMVACALL